MNIMVNAIQSIEGTGEIFIRSYQQDNKVFVLIKDTGTGINEKNLPRIFESGFTTKKTGYGMGIGLSLCKNIIEKHHRNIMVESTEGKGTEFLISLPILPVPSEFIQQAQ